MCFQYDIRCHTENAFLPFRFQKENQESTLFIRRKSVEAVVPEQFLSDGPAGRFHDIQSGGFRYSASPSLIGSRAVSSRVTITLLLDIIVSPFFVF